MRQISIYHRKYELLPLPWGTLFCDRAFEGRRLHPPTSGESLSFKKRPGPETSTFESPLGSQLTLLTQLIIIIDYCITWTPMGYTWISSEGGRSKYFWVWNFRFRDFSGKENVFGVAWSRNFWVFRTIWTFVIVPAYPGCVVLRIKYNQTCFAAVLIFKVLHCICFVKPGWSCLELSFCIVLLLKQQMLLGVSKVVKMATRCGKDNFRWHDD